MLALSLSLGSALVLPSRVATPVAARGSVRMAESVPHDELTLAKYMSLPHPGKVMAEYLWIDSRGEVRSKCRTVDAKKATLDHLPNWNYDGSSTGQAPGEDSEVIIKPKAIFKDPFRPGDNILVLTDTYTPAGDPLPTNTRVAAVATFAGREDEVPWFGIEQEYTLFNLDKVTPLGWPKGGYPGPQGPYYCGAGADRSFGRFISEAHYKACLYAGIQISGTNAEVRPHASAPRPMAPQHARRTRIFAMYAATFAHARSPCPCARLPAAVNPSSRSLGLFEGHHIPASSRAYCRGSFGSW